MIFSLYRKHTTGLVLIVLGIGLIFIALPFSKEFDGNDGLAENLIRNVIIGQIVIREGVIAVVPDRDENLDREFREYLSVHSEIALLSESDAIDRFYTSTYKEKMFRNEFALRMEKMKVITKQEKIAVLYRYIALIGILIFLTGVFVLTKRRKLRTSLQGDSMHSQRKV